VSEMNCTLPSASLNLIHSFTRQRTDNSVRQKTEFATQDENGLSCAGEAVGIASGKNLSSPCVYVSIVCMCLIKTGRLAWRR